MRNNTVGLGQTEGRTNHLILNKNFSTAWVYKEDNGNLWNVHGNCSLNFQPYFAQLSTAGFCRGKNKVSIRIIDLTYFHPVT